MLLYLLGYLGIGITALFVASIFHVSTAVRRGYDIDIINKVNWSIVDDNTNGSNLLTRFVFGWLIWPIRLMQFIQNMDDLYEAYDRYEESI